MSLWADLRKVKKLSKTSQEGKRSKQPALEITHNIDTEGKAKQDVRGCFYISKIGDKGFKDICYKSPEDILNNLCDKFIFYRDVNYYITANSFQKGYGRKEDRLLGLNNIVIDLDNHDKDCDMNMLELKEISNIIETYMGNNDIPLPHIIHRTGRGLHLWWSIEQVPARLFMETYRNTVKLLIQVIEEIIKKYNLNLEVDQSASGNPTGVYRIFDTVNTKIGFETQCDITNFEGKYKLSKLYKDLTELGYKNEKKAIVKANGTDYSPYYISIVNFIEQVVDLNNGNCKGRRNSICYIYYNYAKQIFPNTAVAKLNELNNKFTMPLPSSQINAICRSKKDYKFTSVSMLDKINATEEEKYMWQQLTASFSQRQRERDANRKIKDERNLLIKELFTKKFVLKEKINLEDIAKQVNLSLAQIKRLSAEFHKELKEKHIEHKKTSFDKILLKQLLERIKSTKQTSSISNLLSIFLTAYINLHITNLSIQDNFTDNIKQERLCRFTI